MKRYNIVEIGNEGFVLCQCPTLRIAKKQLKEMEETDRYLKKYYGWSRIPEYKIIETEVK